MSTEQGQKRAGRIGHWVLLATGLVAGCGPASATLPDTGARAVAQGYVEALRYRDWPRAYAALHPDSRSRYSAEQFARLAAQYRSGLGLEPEEVHVRSCEEQETRAVAHVVFTGRGGSRHRPAKDTLLLRRQEAGWGVVLPRDFGQGRTR
jgi:hypothetical protein